MKKQTECEHKCFAGNFSIARLSKEEGGPITGYAADISISCAECGLPFRFVGLPFGSSLHEPRANADSTELRVPIEPAYVTEILGSPLTSGNS